MKLSNGIIGVFFGEEQNIPKGFQKIEEPLQQDLKDLVFGYKPGDTVLVRSCRKRLSNLIGKEGQIVKLSRGGNYYVSFFGSKQTFLFYRNDVLKMKSSKPDIIDVLRSY